MRTSIRQKDLTMKTATPAPAGSALPESALPLMSLRIALIIVATIELFSGISGASVLFGDMSHIGSGLGGGLIKAHLAAHPVLAAAAIVFAAMGRVRHAVIALGAVIIMAWLSDMPSIASHGLQLKGTFSMIETTARIIAFPLIAACAIAYAARNEHLGRATLLVAVPTLFGIVMIVGFAVGVMIYGF